MTRFVLAMIAAIVLSGCQHSGQVVDPFWGRTTVPSPATGSIGVPIVSPGYPQPMPSQPVITQGTPISNGGLQPTTQPNLLPAPMSYTPGVPAATAPAPAAPAPVANGVPNGYGSPALTAPPGGYSAPPAGYSAPPAGYPAPASAPPSGYSNSVSPPSSSPGSPAAPMPGSAPAATYPAAPTTPGGYVPSTSGSAPIGSGPGSSSPAGPTPASPPAALPPGYFPDGGFNYHGSSTQAPSGRGNWQSPSGVASAPVGLDGAIVSAPPGTGAGLGAGPSVVRIPSAADGGSAATPASGEFPAAPAP